MRIRVEIDESLAEDEIVIRCKKESNKITELVEALRKEERRILVRNSSKEEVLLEIKDVFRADTVDDKVFIYSLNNTFETTYRIYELEEILPKENFCRISKAAIINIFKIKSLKTDINRKIKLVLTNGDKEIVNRTYVDSFRGKLEAMKRRVDNEKENY